MIAASEVGACKAPNNHFTLSTEARFFIHLKAGRG
jgi:hypothetical protein